MNTVIIQIGNTDNKLSQHEWHKFVNAMDVILLDSNIHFRGFSNPDSLYQNACWVIEHDDSIDSLCEDITNCRKLYNQDSAAITIGTTRFV